MGARPTRIGIGDVALEHWDDPVHGRVAWRTLISADRTPSDSLVCGIAWFDAGGELKAHRHAPSEVVHVLAGTGTATIGGDEHPMRPGDTLFVPGDRVHAFRAADEGMTLIYFFGRDRFDEVEYVFEAGQTGHAAATGS